MNLNLNKNYKSKSINLFKKSIKSNPSFDVNKRTFFYIEICKKNK